MERSAWTNERLDDRFDQIDRRFDRVDAEIRELRAEMRTGFSEIRLEVAELRSTVSAEIESLRSTMLRLYGGTLIAMFGLIAAILARGGA
jgi:hypothetical protein